MPSGIRNNPGRFRPLKPRIGLVSFLATLLAASSSVSAEPAPSPQPAARPAPAAPTDISIAVTKEGGKRIPLAIPPAIAPINPELQGQAVDPFHKALTEDLGSSPWFILADPTLFPKGARPPETREQGDAWIATSAQYLLDTQISPAGDKITVQARLFDLRTLKQVLGKSYTGEDRSSRRVAHTLADDIVRQFTGKPGPFLTKIAFVSDRDEPKGKEIYLMDFDGANQRRVTLHRSLSLAPDWSPDGAKIVYQSFWKGAPGLFIMSREGGDRSPVPLSTSLNASPSFSPDGKTIAFCGSVRGNPEIFTVNLDGSNLKRLTESAAIDSTPRWSPNGREIAFTSNRQGTPQIFVMDSEGTNGRRGSSAGNWNDEAPFSPDRPRAAFACRNERQMQT